MKALGQRYVQYVNRTYQRSWHPCGKDGSGRVA